jgi:hypothetical protein
MFCSILENTEKGDQMAFRPNYRQQRAERDRAARARHAEKQKRRDEKTTQRKEEHEGTEALPESEREQ